MQRFLKYIGISAVITVASCDEQEVAPIMDPTTKVNFTVTRTDENAASTTVEEGDVLEFTITTDKMADAAIDFSAAFREAAAASGLDDHDYIIDGGTLFPYTKTAVMTVTIVEDDFPETDEALDFDLGANDIAQNWRLSPESPAQRINLPVKSINRQGVITIAISWPDSHDDLDMYIYSVADAGDWGGNASATGANPEINMNLWPEDPNGTYYVGIDPYSLDAGVTTYKFSIGFPDGSVQFFEGTFDLDAAIEGGMPRDGASEAFRLLSVTINNGAVTIAHLNQ